MAKQRDPVLDSMRGIGIVLMVLGHARVPRFGFIYLFHSALLYSAGGFLPRAKRPSAGPLCQAQGGHAVAAFVAASAVYTITDQPVFLKVNILTGTSVSSSAQQPYHHAGDHQRTLSAAWQPLERF